MVTINNNANGHESGLTDISPVDADSLIEEAAPEPNITDKEAIFKIVLPEHNDLETEEIGAFDWHIDNWESLGTAKTYGPIFHVGGYPWRILLFPKGNNQDKSISVYLEIADSKENGLVEDWHVCGEFALAISNPEDPTNYYSNSAHHRFSSEEIDWGFTRFKAIAELNQQPASHRKVPLLFNNEAIISVFIRIVKDETGVLWRDLKNYDSRKEIGYVGIKNQGATCYMNSLLQSLYCTNLFRKAVYQIPTDTDEPAKSVALALQRCFYNLQYSSTPVDTTELTKSFGWDSVEAFMQHDVQEFNRVLQDTLEEKMKNTPADGAISKLFQGKTKSFIKCINVDYESSRVEDYYDIQLNVKGCKDLLDSFNNYIEVETLDGDNKYQAEGHGLQDARKGVTFETFPPVLHLQLKRFEFDFARETMVKINDRHEFPAEINLDKYCSKSDESEPYDYELHGVLVHSGDISGGHYFALLRPEANDKWFCFDDDRVTPVSKKEVFEDNFGDEPYRDNKDSTATASPPFLNRNGISSKKFTNAYMLVYIRKGKLNDILSPVSESDIPFHLKKRLDDEKATIEKRKQDKQDMQLNVKVAVIKDNDALKSYQGFDLAVFDERSLEVSPHVDILKAPKVEKLSEFKQKLMEHYGLEGDMFRLWNISYRTNKTLRIEKLLSLEDEITLDEMRTSARTNTINTGFIKLFLEVAEEGKSLPEITMQEKLVFLKYFDHKEQKLRGLGHIFVGEDRKIESIVKTLVKKAGLPQNTPIQLFEEIKHEYIEPRKRIQTFRDANIQLGAIICFQKMLSREETEELEKKELITSVTQYYTALYNRVCVSFQPKPNPNNRNIKEQQQEQPTIKLELDRTANYKAIAKKLAEELKMEDKAGKIRFTSSYSVSNQPHEVIRYKPDIKLEEMLLTLPKPIDYTEFVGYEHMKIPVMFYEIMDIDLVDLESKRSIDVIIIGPTLRKETKVTVLVSRVGSVSQLLDQVITKGKMEIKEPAKIRLYEALEGKVTKEFSPDQTVDNVATDKLSVVYAEPIPKDELEMNQDTDRLIQVVHYHDHLTDFHSIPFRFVAIKGEPFEETKERLKKRTGLGDMDWKKVKFTILRNLHASQPQVEVIDQPDFELRKARLQEEDALGLDHIDKTSNSRLTNMLKKGIFIKG